MVSRSVSVFLPRFSPSMVSSVPFFSNSNDAKLGRVVSGKDVVDINVLIAKVQAMLRRTYSFAESTNIIEHNGCIFNLNDQTFTYNGKRVELTKNEYRILQSLLENIGKVVSRDNIMMKLWKSDDFIDDNTLTVNVIRLRKKLEQAGLIDYIKTKKGPEYRQI